MKAIKYISLLFLSMITLIACNDDEEISYVLQDISAPTELDAVFDISQDDTGTVSVTPTAVGASIFEVYFGDSENETPTEAAPGETVTHIYGEGQFNLRIVAVGATGLTSELVRVVTISFSAPEDLEVEIIQTNPLELTVTPSATNATVYDIYFGEGEDEEPVTIMNGESAVYTYEAAGEYTVRVVARGAGAATTEVSETVVVEDLREAETFPIDFESNETLSGVFEGDAVSGQPIANPDQSGINTSERVYEFVKGEGAPWYSGIYHLFPEDMDLSVDQVFKINIWSPKAGINVRFQIEKEGGGGTPANLSIDQTVEVAEQWVTLTYDFRGIVDPANGYDKFVIYPDFDDANQPAGDGSTYYIDDIILDLPEEGVLELPITFDDEGVAYDFGTFNGASYEVVDNPNPSGANPDVSKVGAITNSGNQFEGGAFALDTPVDFSGDNKTITMKFWSTVPLPVLLKFEGGVNGERENEVVANHGGTGWEELSFDFANDATKSFIDGSQGVGEPFVPTGQYATMVLFVDGPGFTAGTFYMDDIAQESASQALELPISFDQSGVSYDFGTFNGASYEVVDNPDPTGANPTVSKVGAITNSGNQFEGGAFSLDNPVDFSGNDKTIVMKLWSTAAVPVLLKFEGGVNGERQNEVVANHGGTGWEELSFDFANDATKSFIDGSQGVGEPFVPTGQYATLVLFVDGPGFTAGTFYMDDIEQVAPSTELKLPISFDQNGVSYDFGTFNGASYQVVDNPDPSGANPDVSKVGAIINSGNQFEGGAFVLDIPVDFSGDNKTITMKLWSTSAVPVLLKFEGGVNGERQNEVVANHGGTGWEDLSFDFANDATKSFIDGNQGVGEPFVPTGQYGTLVLFIDGPGFTAGTFYMDDITQQ